MNENVKNENCIAESGPLGISAEMYPMIRLMTSLAWTVKTYMPSIFAADAMPRFARDELSLPGTFATQFHATCGALAEMIAERESRRVELSEVMEYFERGNAHLKKLNLLVDLPASAKLIGERMDALYREWTMAFNSK